MSSVCQGQFPEIKILAIKLHEDTRNKIKCGKTIFILKFC